MANSKPAGLNPFTVICQWHPGEDACDPWQTATVVLTVAGDAEVKRRSQFRIASKEIGALYETVKVVEVSESSVKSEIPVENDPDTAQAP